MKHLRSVVLLAGSLLVVAAVATAAAPERAGSEGTGEPDGRSAWGLCNAWANNAGGRANGGAENATAFRWLREQAGNGSVDAYCEDVPHPKDRRHGGAATPAAADADGNATAADDLDGNATAADPGPERARGKGPRQHSAEGPPHGQANGHGRADEKRAESPPDGPE